MQRVQAGEVNGTYKKIHTPIIKGIWIFILILKKARRALRTHLESPVQKG